MKNKTLKAILTAVSAGVLVASLTGCSLISNLISGASDDGNINIFDLRVSDCVNETTSSADKDLVASLDKVNCADPHDYEVFALLDLRKDTPEYPGDDESLNLAFQGCSEPFVNYTGITDTTANESFGPFVATADSWKTESHQAICVIFTVDGSKITGSLKK